MFVYEGFIVKALIEEGEETPYIRISCIKCSLTVNEYSRQEYILEDITNECASHSCPSFR
jgi:hypothetical protein